MVGSFGDYCCASLSTREESNDHSWTKKWPGGKKAPGSRQNANFVGEGGSTKSLFNSLCMFREAGSEKMVQIVKVSPIWS